MRKLLLVALLAAACLSISGCMTFDQDHDRKILHYWATDIRMMHEDLDFVLYCDGGLGGTGSGIDEIYMR